MRRTLLFFVLTVMTVLTVSAAVSVSSPTDKLSFIEWNDGDTVYFFNVKAEAFLDDGNAYGTQTSISAQNAVLVAPLLQTDGQYIFWNKTRVFQGDYSYTGWGKMFIDNITAPGVSYLDEGTQGHDVWTIKKQGDGVYRIMADQSEGSGTSPDEIGETAFGWNGGDNTIIYPLLDLSDEGVDTFGLDWKIVEGDTAIIQLFVARATLYTQFENAETAGISYDSYIDIYNGSDAAAITSAATELQTTIINQRLTDASDDNPVDISDIISVPDCSDLTVWTYDQTGNGTWQTQSASYTNGDVTINNFIECWCASGSKLGDRHIYQKLAGLPAGSYELTADIIAVQQSGSVSTSEGAYLYGNSYKTTLSTGNGAPESFTVAIVKNAEDTLEIGCGIESANFNWFAMDNYTLIYYGKGTMALRNALQTAIDAASELESANAYEAYLETLEKAIAAADDLLGKSDATSEALTAALEALTAATDSVETNVSLYASLEEELASAQDIINSYTIDELPELETLSEYISSCPDANDEDLGDITTSRGLDNTGVQTVITNLQTLEKKALYSGIKENSDISTILADPTFDNGGEGAGFSWEGLVTVDATYHNCEAYETSFDTYQLLTDLPNGKYTVSIQGFQRPGENSAAYSAFISGDTTTTGYVYANDNEQMIKSIFADRQKTSIMDDSLGTSAAGTGWPYDNICDDGTYVPNSMQGTMYYMNIRDEEGNPTLYDNTISALVTDGTLRFGIRSTSMGSYYWVIFDNVRLFYDGTSTETLQSYVSELAATVASLENQPMNADSLKAMTDALTAAQSNETGGDALIEEIATLQTAIIAARTSISYYSPLVDALDYFYNEIESNPRTNGSTTEIDAVKANMLAGSYADADIESVVEKTIPAYQAYIFSDVAASPDSYSESDPADVTAAIINNDFADNTSDFWTFLEDTTQTNWSTSPGLGYHSMEIYNAKFNFSQNIHNAPKGYYCLVAKGFFRDGAASNDYTNYTAGTVNDSVRVYIGGNDAPLPMLSAGAIDTTGMNLTSTSVVLVDETNSLYVPNNMQNAEVWFSNDITGPKLTVKVDGSALEDNNTLTVGVKNDTYYLSTMWAIIRSLSLYYLGTTAPQNIKNSVSGDNVISQRIYNAAGAEMSTLGKGVNIVRQRLDNGTVRVRKIIVK